MFILAGNAILIFLVISSGISGISESPKIGSESLTQITQISPTITPTFTPTTSPMDSHMLTTSPAGSPTPTVSPTTVNENNPSQAPTQEEKKQETSNIPNNTTGNTGLSLMSQINNFRAGKGLAPLSMDGYTCAFASLRAGEIVSAFNHDGFSGRIDGNSLPYPSYSNVAENIAMNSDPNAVVQGWIDSPGHNENMSKDVPYGCVGISGNYYVFEAWRP